MKKFTLLSLALLMGTLVMAQSGKQVNWTYSSKKVADKTYEIHMTANIGAGWHMYAQEGGDGPISTKFTFIKNPLVAFNNTPREAGKMVKKYEDAFKAEVRYYEHTVDFVQLVKVKSNAKTAVAGKVEFMVCNDHECLPPDEVNFKVNIGG